jgi:hypothetical protein
MLRHVHAQSAPNFLARGILLASIVAFTILFGNTAFASSGQEGFGFNGSAGKASLSGGGSFNLDRGSINGGGGFSCTEAITAGPLAGCEAGQGVRWHAEQLLASSGFKCIGSESLKTAFTGDGVVVIKANFYRAGDGNTESFSANMFVSDHDLNPEIDGVQNLWIQGVGCGPAVVHIG